MCPASDIRLWVVSPRHVKALVGRRSAQSLEWCYFGLSHSRKSKIARILFSVKPINISGELNRIAQDIKQPFLDWADEIGDRQPDKLNWWASRFASKSPFQTDFFILVCYHRLFVSWMADLKQTGTRIVVVEDPWLRFLLQRDFGSSVGVAFVGTPFAVMVNAAFWLVRAPLARLFFILHYSWTKLVANLVLRGNQQTVGQVDPGRAEVLCYTWIENSCFVSPGKLTDAYFGKLEDLLSKNGETVRRMTSLWVEDRFVWRLRPFLQKFLVTQHYITIGDILKSAVSFLRISGLGSLPKLDGYDYTTLVRRELLEEWRLARFPAYQLCYLVFRRLAKDCGSRTKSLIYPFENQPWEKMLCLAIRDEAPWITLIGYQHSSVPPLLLNYCLGKDESKRVPLPDFVVTNGQVSLDKLKSAGFPSGKLINGGTLRFEYLFEEQPRTNSLPRSRSTEFCILVAFPFTSHHAASLLQDLLEAFPSPFLDLKEGLRVAFFLKFHPDLSWDQLADPTTKLPEWFTVSARPLRELMDTADLFLYAPTTGSWREAYLRGLPVLKYLGEFLDIDSTDILTEKEVPLCSTETLRPMIVTMLSKTEASSRETRQRLMGNVFSPVNEDLWLRLVNQRSPAVQQTCSR